MQTRRAQANEKPEVSAVLGSLWTPEPTNRSIHMRRLIFAAVTVFSLACSDSTGPESVLGTYFLRTVNGQPLPWVSFDNGSYKTETTSLSIRLEGGNRFLSTLTERVYLNNVVTTKPFTSSGKWFLSGSSITLTCESAGCGGSYTGIIGGGTMTLSFDDGDVWVFKK